MTKNTGQRLIGCGVVSLLLLSGYTVEGVIAQDPIGRVHTVETADGKHSFKGRVRYFVVDGKRVKYPSVKIDRSMKVALRESNGRQSNEVSLAILNVQSLEQLEAWRLAVQDHASKLKEKAESRIVLGRALDVVAKPPASDIRRHFQLTAPRGHGFSDIGIDSERNRFLSIGGDSAILWDLANGDRIDSITARPSGHFIRVDPMGVYVAEVLSMDRGHRISLTVWDLFAGEQVLDVDEINSRPIFSPDGTTLAYMDWQPHDSGEEHARMNQAAVLANLKTGTQRRVELGLSLHAMRQFSPDGRWFLTVADGKSFVWNTATGELACRLDGGKSKKYVFSPDSNSLLITSSNSHEAYSLPDGGMSWNVNCGRIGGLYFRTFSPDGNLVFGADSRHRLHVWDRKKQKHSSWQAHNDYIYEIVVSPDGQTLATTESDRDNVRVWDVRSRAKMTELDVAGGGPYSRARFSGDGKRLICFSSGLLEAWHVKDLRRDWESAETDKVEAKGAPRAGRETNSKWGDVLSGIPDEVESISVCRPSDIFGKEKGTRPPGVGVLPSIRIFAKDLNIDSRLLILGGNDDLDLLGTYSLAEDGEAKEVQIGFVVSRVPFGKDAIKRFMSSPAYGSSRPKNREFHGKTYTVDENGRFAAYMPANNAMFVAKRAEEIEAIIARSEKPASKLAQQIDAEMQRSQFFKQIGPAKIPELLRSLNRQPMGFPELSFRELQEFLDDEARNVLDPATIDLVTVSGSISRTPWLQANLKFKDKKTAGYAHRKVQFHSKRMTLFLAAEWHYAFPKALESLIESPSAELSNETVRLKSHKHALKD